MRIMNNTLLARNFSFYNLKLNEQGLFYINRKDPSKKDSKKHDIFLY